MNIQIEGTAICVIDGKRYPAVGLGTYRLQGERCFDAVMTAAECGYRIIDTATYYDNFEPIGQALHQLGRSLFYLISKVWPTEHTPDLLRKDLKETLKRLQTNYLDAYLLHWPNHEVPIELTLKTMQEAQQEGIIRQIGLSNVTHHHLKRALEVGIPIHWVQVEMHPFFYDPQLLAFCTEKGIAVQAWEPLKRGKVVEDPLLQSLGKKYGKTAAQVALRWILQWQCLPLPASANRQHLIENLSIGDLTLTGTESPAFRLTREEMELINRQAAKGTRHRIKKAAGYAFNDEFDFTYEQCWPKGI